MGLFFCCLGAVSFGSGACVAKMAERRNADATGFVASSFAWATLVMLIRTALLKSGGQFPAKVIVIAVVFGSCAAVAFLAFQMSISIGKITIGWLMMNLSAGVPAVVSIWKYHEKLTSLKLVAFGLAIVSILLLFWGKRMEEPTKEGSRARGDKLLTWFLLMLVVLLANGMSAFGLKMIAGWSLPGTVKYPYLTAWYAAGLVSLAIPMLFKGVRFGKTELAWGGALAALSIAGQIAMAVALDSGVPGHVVFPVAISGSIFVVALAGRLAFGERMNRTSAVGVALGLLAVVLLGAS
jgi:uncharacterized membrane protein